MKVNARKFWRSSSNFCLVQILHKNGGRAVFSDRDVPIFQEVWQVSNLDHFYQGRPSNQNQAFPFPGGFSDTRSLSDPPPLRRPLQLHPSPIVEVQRKILTVKKPAGCQPTFATLNLDGAPPPTTPLTTPPTLSHPSPPSSPPPPPLHISRQPPLCQAWYDHGHCKYCGRCSMLCVDHHGCYCEEEGVVHCDVCHCTKELRHLAPSWLQTSSNHNR